METLSLNDYFHLLRVRLKTGKISRCGRLITFGSVQLDISDRAVLNGNRESGPLIALEHLRSAFKPNTTVLSHLVIDEESGEWQFALRPVHNSSFNFLGNWQPIFHGNINSI